MGKMESEERTGVLLLYQSDSERSRHQRGGASRSLHSGRGVEQRRRTRYQKKPTGRDGRSPHRPLPTPAPLCVRVDVM